MMVIGLMTVGCVQPDGSSGSAVGVDLGGQLMTGTFYADTVTTVGFQEGSTDFLYVGSAHDIKSEVLVRFFRPVVDTAFVVDSARIEFWYGGGFGDGVTGSLNAQWINYDLTGTPPKISELPIGKPLDPMVQETAVDTGKITIPLDVVSVTDWLLPDTSNGDDNVPNDFDLFDIPGSGNGTIFTVRVTAPNALNKLIRIRSGSSDTLRPKLYIYSTSMDTANQPVVDSLSVIPQLKMSLIEDSTIPSSDQIVVGDGSIILPLIRFDISELTDLQASMHIVINRAVVTFYRNKSIYPWGVYKGSISLRSQRLTGGKWLSDITQWVSEPEYAGYPFNTATVDSSSDSLEFVVTYPTTDWVSEIDENFGILVQPYSTQFYPLRKGVDIERVAFHSIDDPNQALRPKLTVHYTEFVR